MALFGPDGEDYDGEHYEGLIGATWLHMGLYIAQLSPNDHPSLAQGLSKVIQKL